MVLGDITNVYRTDGSYTPSCVIPAKYRPCIYRGQRLADQTPRMDFPAKRKAGDTNIDLWLDGSIYPPNPATNAPPPFHDLKSLLCFVGDGAIGLLRYAKLLQSADENGARCAELVSLVATLDARMRQLQTESEAERIGLLYSWEHDKIRYERHISMEMTRFQAAAEEHQVQLRHLQDSIAAHIADKVRHSHESTTEVESLTAAYSKESQRLQHNYEVQIQDINLELLTTKNALVECQLKCNRLKGNLTGGRNNARKKKDYANLKKTGGRAKRVKAAIRELVAPNTVATVRECNAATGLRKRLCGARQIQTTTGAAFAKILSQCEGAAMMGDPKFKKIAVGITNQHLVQVGEKVCEQTVARIMDVRGMPESAYNEIFKTMNTAVREVDKGLKFKAMPRPHRVTLLRTTLNSNLGSFIGDYFHIDNSWAIPQKPNEDSRNRTSPTHLNLNDGNNLFVDLETVQRSMIKHYRFTLEEIGLQNLIFVLKMDEAEIVKGEKMERVSITLMNRALHEPNLPKNHDRYFSVQAEGDIWPIGTFRVLKESHDCLRWVFEQTPFPSIISAQSKGQKLDVPGIGEFGVEWHLSCDMKTVKCLYGFSHGANAQHSCMYCWQKRAKRRTLTQAEAREPWKFKQSWNGGLFSRSVSAKPVRGPDGGPDGTGKWSPIFDIPIENVHFCTLHALCRIVEKIVHLQICYVWLIKDNKERSEAVAAMEHALSKAGLAAGAVVLTRDAKLSGENSDLPRKLSFNGSKCRKMFNPSTWSNLSAVWKDVCEAERNNTARGQSKQDRQDCWAAFEELQIYFTAMALTPGQKAAYKGCVERWGRAYVKAFGEGAVTHYVHVIVKHSAWFVAKYGSLALWSTQGMEKTHYAAKTAYVKHTQHFGTNQRHSPIVQQFEWWYRTIQHREFEREKTTLQIERAIVDREQGDVRRQTLLSSTAAEKHRAWRATRRRDGSRWVPVMHDNESGDFPVENINGETSLEQHF